MNIPYRIVQWPKNKKKTIKIVIIREVMHRYLERILSKPVRINRNNRKRHGPVISISRWHPNRGITFLKIRVYSCHWGEGKSTLSDLVP